MRMPGFAGVLLSVLLFQSAAWGGDAAAGKSGTGTVGAKAPGFSAVTLAGERLESAKLLEKYRGVVVNFWGLRCGPCIEEMPHLNALFGKYGDRVAFLGVNVDAADGETLSQHIRKMGHDIRYPVIPDPDFRLVDAFGLSAAPLTVVIAPDGTVRYRHDDFKAGDEKALEEVVASLLR